MASGSYLPGDIRMLQAILLHATIHPSRPILSDFTSIICSAAVTRTQLHQTRHPLQQPTVATEKETTTSLRPSPTKPPT
jgi:hypothetical protein